jgi:uncharacterized metal-binding protein
VSISGGGKSLSPYYSALEDRRFVYRSVPASICFTYLIVARILSDVLSRNRDDPDFSVSILTCSVTYM